MHFFLPWLINLRMCVRVAEKENYKGVWIVREAEKVSERVCGRESVFERKREKECTC